MNKRIEIRNPLGPDPIFLTVEDMQEAIDKYFAGCDRDKRPYTTTGLALALNMSRETLLRYEKKDAFIDTVKKAKIKVQQYAEESLFKSGIATGVIFNLKNNHGWKDQYDHNVGGIKDAPVEHKDVNAMTNSELLANLQDIFKREREKRNGGK